MIQHDTQFEERILTEVRQCGKGWEISQDGLVFFMPDCGITPKPGDVARFYGKGFGYTVRGLTINGAVAFYRTEEQERERHEQWCRDEEARRQEEFAKNREQIDADYAALPAEFQRRLDRFRSNNPAFRWQHEPYELFCCTEAVMLARTLESGAAIEAFRARSWEEQKAAVPKISDQHSGNTFGASIHLAWLYIENPDTVEQEHGALCPLVGCESYGCVRPAGL